MIAYIRIIRTKNFTARAIHLGMWLYAVLRFKKPTKSYNHSEIGYKSILGGNMTSGAVAEGVRTIKWKDYLKAHSKIEFLEYKILLKPHEWLRGKEYLGRAEGTKYEYENFWHHTIKIFTGIWKGSNRATELYCYEHVIRFLNATGVYNIDTNMNPYQFKIYADENLI